MLESGPYLRRGLRPSLLASAAAALSAGSASTAGLLTAGGHYADSQSVLVSRGADAANLLPVVILLSLMGLAYRGSLVALLLWPGTLFYLCYACIPYLVGAPFTPVVFSYVATFLAAATGLILVLAALEPTQLRYRFATAHSTAADALAY